MNYRISLSLQCSFVVALVLLAGRALAADGDVNYQSDVAPVLQKYCAGCHNDTDLAGDFSLATLDTLRKGTPEGAVLEAGKPNESKLIKVLFAEGDAKMPPEDEPQPSVEQIELVRKWVEQGAAGEAVVMSLTDKLKVPKLPAAAQAAQYVGAACLVDSQLLAIGRLGSVELTNTATNETLWTNSELPGKVNSIRLSHDHAALIVGGGVAGLGGEVTILDAKTGATIRRLQGHSDTVYCAAMSPNGKWIASGSYDRSVILWDAATGEIVQTLSGHNGAIYDLDFDPSSTALATASADQTVKLWNLQAGLRLDTFGQPEGEMHCVRFSQDGKFVFAGGSDRQIRKWRIVSLDKPAINPMLVTRFAHESEVLQLQRVGSDRLVSASRDRTIKLWDIDELRPLGEIGETPDQPVALCVSSEGSLIAVALNGISVTFAANGLTAEKTQTQPVHAVAMASEALNPDTPFNTFSGEEPNDDFANAIPIDLPAEINGIVAPANSAIREDVDLYRFQAKAGQKWIFEVKAARDGSKLDSRIDILDEQGRGVVRTRLQALRESYFTFRGKDSDTSDDFRMHKWEDMELDEYLYSSGEVVRLWLYPRGPDSGFKVYPGAGNRDTFFDTTPISHALGEPAYVVRELAADEQALPNGLPTFPIYFENDDDSLRRFGMDSRMTFVAPADGMYFVRIRDSRGFGGPDYKYQLTIRSPKPDFAISVGGQKMDLKIGSGGEWSATVTRTDGLEGAIAIKLSGLPAGLIATNPLIIEPGQVSGIGAVYASAEAQTLLAASPVVAEEPTAEKQADETTEKAVVEPTVYEATLVATSEINGQTITHELPEKLQITVSPASGIRFDVVDAQDSEKELTELTIQPGQTVSAKIVMQRGDQSGAISFGRDDSGRGLPHGAYVDNIGLNGLLIPAEQSEREFFITAAPKLQPGRYQFHLKMESNGNPTCQPLWLNVIANEP